MRFPITILTLIVLSACTDDKESKKVSGVRAICQAAPATNLPSDVRGLLAFYQEDDASELYIIASIRGLNPNQPHGIHIHQLGDLSNSCLSIGSHYNPETKLHGGPSDNIKHIGDMGNIQADPNGKFYGRFRSTSMSLFGNKSIIGRSVAIHAKTDDLGRANNEESKKTGNSGARMACGVITYAPFFRRLSP